MSTLTREFTKEQLQQIEAAAKEVLWPVVWSENKARKHFSEKITPEVVLGLARIALASLEAEAVYQVYGNNDDTWSDVDEEEMIRLRRDGEDTRTLHTAPSAPVSVLERLRSIVADPRALPRRKEWISGQQYSYVLLENVEAMVDEACRAAMLQGADGKPELTVWYGAMPETNGKTNWTAILHRKGECLSTGITIDRSEYPERVRYEADRIRHLIGELADEPDILSYDADAHSGYVERVTTAYKLRDAVETIRNSGIAIDAEKILADRDVLNTPDCSCRTCRPVTFSDSRFVVCPECGNKRCPHANDHRNACTGSNEPGQEGSAYPAAPQQEA